MNNVYDVPMFSFYMKIVSCALLYDFPKRANQWSDLTNYLLLNKTLEQHSQSADRRAVLGLTQDTQTHRRWDERAAAALLANGMADTPMQWEDRFVISKQQALTRIRSRVIRKNFHIFSCASFDIKRVPLFKAPLAVDWLIKIVLFPNSLELVETWRNWHDAGHTKMAFGIRLEPISIWRQSYERHDHLIESSKNSNIGKALRSKAERHLSWEMNGNWGIYSHWYRGSCRSERTQ